MSFPPMPAESLPVAGLMDCLVAVDEFDMKADLRTDFIRNVVQMVMLSPELSLRTLSVQLIAPHPTRLRFEWFPPTRFTTQASGDLVKLQHLPPNVDDVLKGIFDLLYLARVFPSSVVLQMGEAVFLEFAENMIRLPESIDPAVFRRLFCQQEVTVSESLVAIVRPMSIQNATPTKGNASPVSPARHAFSPITPARQASQANNTPARPASSASPANNTPARQASQANTPVRPVSQANNTPARRTSVLGKRPAAESPAAACNTPPVKPRQAKPVPAKNPSAPKSSTPATPSARGVIIPRNLVFTTEQCAHVNQSPKNLSHHPFVQPLSKSLNIPAFVPPSNNQAFEPQSLPKSLNIPAFVPPSSTQVFAPQSLPKNSSTQVFASLPQHTNYRPLTLIDHWNLSVSLGNTNPVFGNFSAEQTDNSIAEQTVSIDNSIPMFDNLTEEEIARIFSNDL